MENDVMSLIESLYTVVTEARGVPLGKDKCMLDREAVLNLLDDIKVQLPVELAEAKRLVTARDEFIGNAKQEAESLRRAAEDRARMLVDQQEIVRAARNKSNEMVVRAEQKSRELRQAANAYVDDALRRTEEAVNAALDEVRQSRQRYRAAASAAAAALNQQAVMPLTPEEPETPTYTSPLEAPAKVYEDKSVPAESSHEAVPAADVPPVEMISQEELEH